MEELLTEIRDLAITFEQDAQANRSEAAKRFAHGYAEAASESDARADEKEDATQRLRELLLKFSTQSNLR